MKIAHEAVPLGRVKGFLCLYKSNKSRDIVFIVVKNSLLQIKGSY